MPVTMSEALTLESTQLESKYSLFEPSSKSTLPSKPTSVYSSDLDADKLEEAHKYFMSLLAEPEPIVKLRENNKSSVTKGKH